MVTISLPILRSLLRLVSAICVGCIVLASFHLQVSAQIIEQIEDRQELVELGKPGEESINELGDESSAASDQAASKIAGNEMRSILQSCDNEVTSVDVDDADVVDESEVDSEAKKTSIKSPRWNAKQLARKSAIERCLAIYYTRQIDAGELRPWSLMHGLLAYGRDSRVVSGNQSVNAVEYMCNNGIGDDRKLMSVESGKIRMHVGRGYQGHAGQLLAMLAQSSVAIEQPVTIDTQKFSLRDLVEYEKLSCRDQTELTFKLIGLSNYLDSDATWRNNNGQEWSISRMLEEEIKQPIIGAACGGTHRLMGLSYAIEMRAGQAKPIDGQWSRADSVVKRHQDLAFSFQHIDGSFSTAFFQRKATQGDMIDHLLATGHQLEWLVFSLPEDELKDPRIESAIDYVVTQMLNAPNYNLDVGPRGHAIRALKLYEEKVFGASDHTQLMPSGVHRVTKATTTPAANNVVARPASYGTRSNQPRSKPRRFGRNR